MDATNHPGVYELQIADARFAVTSAKSLLISISGATNMAQCDALVPLTDTDPYSGDAYTRIGTPANASLAADVAAVKSDTSGLTTNLAEANADLDELIVSVGTPMQSGDDVTLTSGERNAVAVALLDLADGVESGITVRKSLRAMAAALAGQRTNAGTENEQFDAIGNPDTPRIVGNMDASGNGEPTLTL